MTPSGPRGTRFPIKSRTTLGRTFGRLRRRLHQKTNHNNSLSLPRRSPELSDVAAAALHICCAARPRCLDLACGISASGARTPARLQGRRNRHPGYRLWAKAACPHTRPPKLSADGLAIRSLVMSSRTGMAVTPKFTLIRSTLAIFFPPRRASRLALIPIAVGSLVAARRSRYCSQVRTLAFQNSFAS